MVWQTTTVWHAGGRSRVVRPQLRSRNTRYMMLVSAPACREMFSAGAGATSRDGTASGRIVSCRRGRPLFSAVKKTSDPAASCPGLVHLTKHMPYGILIFAVAAGIRYLALALTPTMLYTKLCAERGEVSERLKEHDWKSCVRETVPRVQIPLSPPIIFEGEAVYHGLYSLRLAHGNRLGLAQ